MKSENTPEKDIKLRYGEEVFKYINFVIFTCGDCKKEVMVNDLEPKKNYRCSCGKELKDDIYGTCEHRLNYINQIKGYEFLDEPEIIHHNINQGTINNQWYFGKLFSEKDKVFEGIVTTEKKVLINSFEEIKIKGETITKGINEIKDYGLTYLHNLETNKNFWTNSSIKQYLKSENKINKQEVYNKIKETIKSYMDVQDDRIYDVATNWIIGTYCYELFETYGYLYFHALRESGKSKFKKILRLIGFNSQEASSISEASFFRTIENTKGLLCIDEYEKMDTDRKKATDLLLNAGIEKGAAVKRCEITPKKIINRDYDVYCPKIICNITGLDATTKTRCITIPLNRTVSKKGNKKPKTADPIWQELRNSCYILIMDYWKEIKDIYDNYVSPLKNRNEDIWMPVLVLSKFFNSEDEIKGYAIDNIKQTEIETIENDRTYQILNELLECYLIQDEPQFFYIKDLADYLKEQLNFGIKDPIKVVGFHLSSLNIFKKKREGKGFKYEISKKLLLLAMNTRGYPIPKKYDFSVVSVVNVVNVYDSKGTQHKKRLKKSQKKVKKLHKTTPYTLTTLNYINYTKSKKKKKKELKLSINPSTLVLETLKILNGNTQNISYDILQTKVENKILDTGLNKLLENGTIIEPISGFFRIVT